MATVGVKGLKVREYTADISTQHLINKLINIISPWINWLSRAVDHAATQSSSFQSRPSSFPFPTGFPPAPITFRQHTSQFTHTHTLVRRSLHSLVPRYLLIDIGHTKQRQTVPERSAQNPFHDCLWSNFQRCRI